MSGLSVHILSLVGGLIVLAIAGDVLVNGAASLAKRLGVPALIGGIFIVGFGTSAPEMVVAVDAALNGYPELALGNIVGSNIANIWLVLSLPALVAPLATGSSGERLALSAMLITTAAWIGITAISPLHAGVAVLFLGALFVYAVITYFAMRGSPAHDVDEEPDTLSLRRAAGFTLIGLIGLPLGANLIVDGGVGIARGFDISEEFIGLTLLAVGTSLPEIGAGIAAVLRKRGEILVGNVLGSNIFNILGAGGLVSFFGPVEVAGGFPGYSHWAMAAAAGTVAIFVVRGVKVSRLAAIAMLLIYALYLYGLIVGWNFLALMEQPNA